VSHGVEKKRKRVLLLAYACNPYRGGEHGVGWHRAVESAKYYDTWVLCKEEKNKKAIETWMKEHGAIPGLYFHFIHRSKTETLLHRVPGFWYATHNRWHRRAYRAAVKLHQEVRFDLVQQVTICSFREPGYLWRLDVPFVWGPVGGTKNYPWRFLGLAGVRGAIKEGLHSFFNILQFRFSPRVRIAVRKAAAVVAANSKGKEDFARVHKIKTIALTETGVECIPELTDVPAKNSDSLNLLWSGVFEDRKALPLLLLALSRLPSSFAYELRILGNGPLEKRWRALAEQLGVNSRCTWLGWLPHEEAMKQYIWGDVFVFTSLRDTTGTVIPEALSHGLPVICLDHQGVGDVVTEDCGIKIAVTEPNEVIRQLQQVVVSLSNDRAKLAILSQGAKKRAADYLWSKIGAHMANICQKALETHRLSPAGAQEQESARF
jgi:glycosyltransferase involved in cell wall biosynthesis